MSSLATSPQPKVSGRPSRSPARAGLAAILLIEVALFAWSFGKFFCGDSLFFFSRRISSASEFLKLLTSIDPLFTYRPLTFAAFTYLMFPVAGLNPLAYHAITLGVHLLTTLLVFLLLRRLASDESALIGTFLFGTHHLAFYLTYDPTFLPDYGMGVMAVAALLAFARALQEEIHWPWNVASLLFFALSLGFKESAVTLIVGFVVVGWLAARDRPRRLGFWRLLLPHSVLTAAYLLFQLHLRGGRFYPSDGHYSISSASGVLFRKLSYIPFALNIAPDLQNLWLFAATAAIVLPALVWMLARIRNLWRGDRVTLALCGIWALAGISPVLFVNNLPIEDLFFPVLALGVAMARGFDSEPKRGVPLARAIACVVLPFVLSVGLQIHSDLKSSWMARASDAAERSLGAVKRAYPVLPRGATLYMLPTTDRWLAWYFDRGSLFNLFYGDPSLHVLFADYGAKLPPDYARRADVLTLQFLDGRLWDVTPAMKRDAMDTETTRLLDREPAVESRLTWPANGLIEGKAPVLKRLVARDEQCRPALVQMPGTTARFPLNAITPDSVLQIGLTLSRPTAVPGSARARLLFESESGREVLDQFSLDADVHAGHWLDSEIDLSRFAGRAGSVVLEADSDPSADWVAWSRLRMLSRSSRFYPELRAEASRAVPPQLFRLLDRFEQFQVSFDRSEFYPDYTRFETPTGQPVFLYSGPQISPARNGLVTLAGATARFEIASVPENSVLELGAANAGQVGDGVHARAWIETEDGARADVFDETLPARSKRWIDRTVSLKRWANKRIRLVLSASSGKKGNTAGDWCTWSRLRIVPAGK